MKKVIVLGAKPGAHIPEGDCIYCANAAIGYYSDQISKFDYVVNVVSGGVLASKDKSDKNRKLMNNKYKHIVKSKPNKMVLIDSYFSNMKEEFAKDGYHAEQFINISSKERRDLVYDITRLADPILTKDLFNLPLLTKFYLFFRVLISFLRININNKYDYPDFFRVSTGVFALIYAIYENGFDAHYIISGCSLKDRGIYIDGKKSENNRVCFKLINILEPHIIADRKVLMQIKNIYKIFTTEEELSSELGIKIYM